LSRRPNCLTISLGVRLLQMGDVPHSNAPNESPAPDAIAASYPGTVSYDSAHSQQYQQQQYGIPNVFTNQLGMAQQQGQARGGPYNMNAMMNALPQSPGYRQPPFNPGQQRFNSAGASSSAVNHAQQPQLQYAGQSNLMNPMTNQSFYVPQQAPMTQYYGGPISPIQQQHGNMPQRSNMGFYPNQMAMNTQQGPPSANYYYPAQTQQFAAQTQSVQGHMMRGQYPPQMDPRLMQQHGAEQLNSDASLPASESRRELI